MKLMFIDDEQTIVNGLCRLLDYAALGYDRVLSASVTSQALEIIAEEKPEMIISDIVMPGMTGLELMRQVRELSPESMIAFLSGYQKFSYAQEAVSLGAMAYLLKPVDRGELEQLLRRAAERVQQRDEGHRLTQRLRSLSESREERPIPVSSPAGHCCVALVQVMSKQDRSRLETGLLQFAAYSRAESLAQAAGITSFVKDEQLLLVCQGAEESGLRDRMQALLRELTVQLEGQLPVAVESVCGEVLADSRGIPGEHTRLLTLLSTRQVTVEKAQDPIQLAMDYMQQHYGENLTLESTAAVACMSTSYFSSMFHKETGMGFKAYLTQLRLQAARKLLMESGMKIYEIAEAVGIGDTRYFS